MMDNPSYMYGMQGHVGEGGTGSDESGDADSEPEELELEMQHDTMIDCLHII